MCKKALMEAVGLAGGQVRLAELVNAEVDKLEGDGAYLADARPVPLRQQHITAWLNQHKGPVPPSQYVVPMERAVGVSRFRLRSDVFGACPAAAA